MGRHDWDTIDALAFEIACMEEASQSVGTSGTELESAYARLRELLRPAVTQMARELLRDSHTAEREAARFLERLPLILPLKSASKIPCSRWVAGALIEFIYQATDSAAAALEAHEARLLQELAEAEPVLPLSAPELDLIERVRTTLLPDEFLVWYDYVVNGYAIAEIAAFHGESHAWVERTLQRARQKLWNATTTDTARRTKTDLLGQSLTWLGVPSLYEHSSVAYSVANDGTVAGVAFAEEYRYSDTRGNYAAYIPCAFRWKDYQFHKLGELGENCTPRCMITPQGDTIVAASEACLLRWSAERGVEQLTPQGLVCAMNACGNVLVGEAGGHAARWINSVLEPLADEVPSAARGVSANGKFIVGHIRHQAVRWEASGAVRYLGTLEGEHSEATAVSQDGSTIVGKSDGRAFRWTPETGMCALSQHEHELSQAYSVSYDGTRIVGEASDEAGVHAFLWTAEDGMQDLNVLFAHLREVGATLERAYAISPNGRYIVGEGYCSLTERKEAFLIDLGELAC
ncbi:MAG: hypothetical protein NZ874_04645 [Fimbriimonadales bacterium]|nr:hypothetical protein [Fimbriimonadales bacterium]